MQDNYYWLKTLFLTSRPPFLILTPVCVFLGLSFSADNLVEHHLIVAALISVGALAAHISVNMLNEYFDFSSGLDLITSKTPFSGGSGALPARPEGASLTLISGLISLALTIVIGMIIVYLRGEHVLPFGLVGVVLVVAYTKWINRMPWLCLISPGLGFGTLMVVGSNVVLEGEHSQLVWEVSMIPFFLINNLLLLNQYPDITADEKVGRKTFPIVYGVPWSNAVFGLSTLASFAILSYVTLSSSIPLLALVALLPMSLSLYALVGAVKHRTDIGGYPHYMAANVGAAILTPLFLASVISFA